MKRGHDYHLTGIPDPEWAMLKAKAGARLAEGLRYLVVQWARGRISPFPDPEARREHSAEGGRIGGAARAARLTAKRRSDIAKKAGEARRQQIEARRAAGLPLFAPGAKPGNYKKPTPEGSTS